MFPAFEPDRARPVPALGELDVEPGEKRIGFGRFFLSPALPRGAVSPAAWTAAVYSGVSAIGIGTLCWNHGVARLGSARTALYSNLTPLVALVVAWLTLGETLTRQQGWGALAAVAGVVLARRHTRPR